MEKKSMKNFKVSKKHNSNNKKKVLQKNTKTPNMKKKISNKTGGNTNNIQLFTSNNSSNDVSLGIVTAMAMKKFSAFKGFLSGVSSLVFNTNEKFSGVHDSVMETQNKALNELITNAKKIGARKVVGIKIDNSEITSGGRSGIFVVYVYGTAIK
jgi:uncharacterized protein YbjQ (UPF0145 family)